MVISREEKKQHLLRLGSSGCVKAGPDVGKLHWLNEGCHRTVLSVTVEASLAAPLSVKTKKIMLRLHLLRGG